MLFARARKTVVTVLRDCIDDLEGLEKCLNVHADAFS